ncbi:SDR family oxidoreductase [Streptomyces bobili]|uniref:SDR family oxidoreductase n=1 Tax=Streptomyces bobili TaxID=67280 RepID=UPI00364AA3A5
MSAQSSLAGRTVLMSGGSRGIGLAIAVRLAGEGANIAFIAKTDTPHPRVAGTVHTAAAEIEAAGGRALPILGDIRDDDTVSKAVTETAGHFGGIDIVINNASAISLSGIGELPLKRYDLMQDVNARGTFALMSAAMPYLGESVAPRVLTLSPPLSLDRRWLVEHAPYTVSKYAMTMLTLGVAEQYREQGFAACCLWPRTLIATAAVQNVVAGDEGMRSSRRPEIMADAAALVLGLDPSQSNGQCFVDEDVLRAQGVTDLSRYLYEGATEENLAPDLLL